MRLLFILAFVANLVLTLISLAILPERVAIHFGDNGTPNGWAPNYGNALITTVLDVFIFAVMFFAPRLLNRIPARWINLPNKDYWLQPAMLPQTRATFSLFMWRFGAAMFLFLFATNLLSIHANLSNPVALNLYAFLPVFMLFLAFACWWVIAFHRAFRVPEGTGPSRTFSE